MKAKNINVILRRAIKRSNTLNRMKDYNFPIEVETLTISENAPESIKLTGYTPISRGWKELSNNDLTLLNDSKLYPKCKLYNIWVKTATLGGRKRIWTQKIKRK